MKYKTTAILIIVLSALGINNATADSTGMDLLTCIKASDKEAVSSPKDAYSFGFLIGSIQGIMAAGDGLWFKVPNDVSNGQLIEIVRKYLRDNPDKLNKDSEYLIIYAIAKTYPLSANERPIFPK
jgi:hypothetical protein